MSTALMRDTAASVSVPWMTVSWLMAAEEGDEDDEDDEWPPRPRPRPRPLASPREPRREESRFGIDGADMVSFMNGGRWEFLLLEIRERERG